MTCHWGVWGCPVFWRCLETVYQWWENHGKIMGKSWNKWENHGKIMEQMGKSWENHGTNGKIMGNSWNKWENHGKNWKIMENHTSVATRSSFDILRLSGTLFTQLYRSQEPRPPSCTLCPVGRMRPDTSWTWDSRWIRSCLRSHRTDLVKIEDGKALESWKTSRYEGLQLNSLENFIVDRDAIYVYTYVICKDKIPVRSSWFIMYQSRSLCGCFPVQSVQPGGLALMWSAWLKTLLDTLEVCVGW